MKPAALLTLLLVSQISFAQEYMSCLVAQYKGESKKFRYVVKRNYDIHGNLLSQLYQGFKTSESIINADGNWTYSYKDNRCVLKTQISGDLFRKGDTIRTFYYYGTNGRLEKEEEYSYKKHFSENADFGFGSADGCIPGSEDYESNKRWKATQVITYKYDNVGRKTERRLRGSRYTWKYDSQGKLIALAHYEPADDIHPSSLETYVHAGNSYTMTKIAYNGAGKDVNYWSDYVWQYRTDAKGNLLEKSLLIAGKQIEREVTEYDNQGRPLTYVHYNAKGKPEIKHKYLYKILEE